MIIIMKIIIMMIIIMIVIIKIIKATKARVVLGTEKKEKLDLLN